MTKLLLAACFGALLLPGVALAAKPPTKPVAQWTCEEFLAIDDTFRPKVVYWASAYAKGGQPESTTVDVEGTEKIVPAIVDACTKSTKNSFWQTMKSEIARVAADVKQDVRKDVKAIEKDAKTIEKDAKAIEKKM